MTLAVTITFLNFLAMLLIAGGFLRTIEAKWPDLPIVKALAYLY